jgi:antitoxin HicB
MAKKMNPHLGSSPDDLLREMGMLEEVHAAALSRVIALRIADELRHHRIRRSALAKRMKSSRMSVDRLLDGSNGSVTLSTLGRAAAALGLRLEVEREGNGWPVAWRLLAGAAPQCEVGKRPAHHDPGASSTGSRSPKQRRRSPNISDPRPPKGQCDLPYRNIESAEIREDERRVHWLRQRRMLT